MTPGPARGCLGSAHVPNITVNKTFVFGDGRPSMFEPCDSEFQVKTSLFDKTKEDEKTSLSIEDKEFLILMDSDFIRDQDGFWTAPLPFRKNRPPLPDNRSAAMKRAKSFDLSLVRNPIKLEHVRLFMDKIFERGHAEPVPSLCSGERWYLPMFGIHHPRKPESIRVVFDPSARYSGLSLNDTLMKGPDLSNSLHGILMRFRRERVAVIGDVEQMFHNLRSANTIGII